MALFAIELVVVTWAKTRVSGEIEAIEKVQEVRDAQQAKEIADLRSSLRVWEMYVLDARERIARGERELPPPPPRTE